MLDANFVNDRVIEVIAHHGERPPIAFDSRRAATIRLLGEEKAFERL